MRFVCATSLSAPDERTLLIVEAELEGATQWAARVGISLSWDSDALELHSVLTQPETGELFYLRGRVDGYRAVPPAWTFSNPMWVTDCAPDDYPSVPQSPFGASIFIKNAAEAVICAPFNRLAYAEYHGPHGDWNGAAQWLTAGAATQVIAHHLGDMLAVIHRDFVSSRGRLS